jgi:hypothetical protein
MNRFVARLAALLPLGAVLLTLLVPAASAQQPAKGTIRVVDWTAPVAAGWVQQPPANTMRLAQFQVPGKGKDGNAEVVVFYFGQGGGGPLQANIDRWVSQFTTADGKPVKPVITKAKAAGMPLTTVELHGSYSRGVGMGPQGDALPNHSLLAYVVETPKGNVTFHLWGPRATVAANRKGIEAMVQGLKAGG